MPEINQKQNIVVFFYATLDGIVSYLVLCWLYNRKLPYVATTPAKLEQDFDKWSQKQESVDRVYFLALDVSKIGEMIDHKSSVILHNHKTIIYPFTEAICRQYEETSCAKLVYDTFFKNTQKIVSNSQKTLVALCDDFTSYKNATPLSQGLNIVYHSMQNKVQSFIEDYYKGFEQFDKFKQNTIELYKKHRNSYLQELQPFVGVVNFEEVQNVKVGAIFCEKYVQECCDYLFEKFQVDVAIAVMLEQKRVAVRRNFLNEKVDVSKFVQRICEGGGHKAAAGGSLTEEFMEFTKILKPI